MVFRKLLFVLLIVSLTSCSSEENDQEADNSEPPYVSFAAPADGAEFLEGSIISVIGEAFDSDGISSVQLYVNGELNSTDTTAPFEIDLGRMDIGTYSLMLRSLDTQGNRLDSDSINITINPDNSSQPFVTITSPEDGAQITQGNSVVMTVNAYDPDGISELNLRVDGSFYAKDRDAPYEFDLSGLAEGSYSLSVRSRDTLGNALDSTPISLTVNTSSTVDPFVNITSPNQGDTFVTGQTITVIADADDPDGIDAARLWVDGNYYDVDSTAPFTFSVTGLSAGAHTLMVRTRDSLDNALDSDIVTVDVQPAPYITFTSPTDGTNYDEGNTLDIIADAFDPDGVASVQLFVDGNLNSTDSSAPYSFELSGLVIGSYNLQLLSTDNLNNTLNSNQITVNVVQPDSATDLIDLPIEVLGAAGTTKSITFNLSSTANISHLYIECNACGYHELALDKDSSMTKATVTVNNGQPIALKKFTEGGQVFGNSQISILGGAALYGGIGGGFRTVRMMVPTSDLKMGENVVTFKHEDALPPSIGFRIVDFNTLANGDVNNKVLSAANFNVDEPKNWEAPLNSANDIEEGRQLWTQRDLLEDPWVDSLDGQSGGAGPMSGDIKASCANCHANDGRDLKYFNFSNLSIVERSKFHGLTEEQGNKIASYIRQLDIPVVDQARPWNPAYQPGPGLDALPVYEWAAGAGMNAVLDDDADIAPYLFPNGTSLTEVRKVVDRYDTLNLRELPVNIPMPEWNQWLPIIHPDDAFDTADSAVTSDQFGNDVGKPYYEELYQIALGNPTPTKIGRITIFIKRWLGKGLTCQTNGVGSGEPLRGLNGDVLDAVIIDLNTPDPTDVTRDNCNQRRDTPGMQVYEIAKRGLTAWSSVKLWEIAHSLNLEEESKTMNSPVCSGSVCIDASEPRGWEIDGRNVFDRPPHFVGTASGRRFFTQNQMLGILESNAWYHLNMVLNSGYRQSMPSHFAYTYSHVQLLQFESNVNQGYRYWATLIKQRQLQTSGEYGIENGLDLRTAEPYVYYGSARNTTRTDTHDNIGQALWGRLATAFIEDLVADASNASDSDWANASGNYSVQPKNSTNFSACGNSCTFDIGPYQGRNTYRVIPKLREIGVEESAINNLINWAENTWPNGPWDDVR